MTDSERIEHLMTTPPQVLTKRERVERGIMRFLGFMSVVAFAVAAAALIVDASASCVNTALATRNGPSQRDAAAHIAYAHSQQALAHANDPVAAALVQAINADTPAEKRAATAAFVKAFLAQRPVAAKANRAADAYVKQLESDQATRNSHPLGQC